MHQLPNGIVELTGSVDSTLAASPEELLVELGNDLIRKCIYIRLKR